ncbi:transcriptional regulator [Flexivirga endophytica]|uniref:Transcriptional regulator n=1 Tax=Flexivirga endophytica TaxID=1849103 RepID=A0A916WU06_9MICO|nr:helix-turn-helix transcriptional regulator [Flexivirga endophytica]GGB30520.1 transcriptional regulator [Flexivirga endophytica]GHB51422.1 transcriptional regulator [Flexivirga endophytica]
MAAELTTASYLVLGILDMAGPASAYDVKQFSTTFVAPFWSLPHTQVYLQCKRLVELGLLEQQDDDDPRGRKELAITDAGRAELDQWRSEPTTGPVTARDLSVLKNFFGGPSEQIATEQVAQHRAKLEAYREWRGEHGPNFDDGQSAALELGLRYEELMVDYWQGFLDHGPSVYRIRES